MADRPKVRMGIDVGGTYTKCVAMDNATHEIIGKNEVKTTHDDERGVAAGVVQSFRNCMAENDIKPEDVVFVAHSTTQATNAFIEGDVASVGIIGVAGGGLEGFLAKRQLNLKDIILDEKVGRKIPVRSTYIKKKQLIDATIDGAIEELLGEGAQVIVASMAFGVDSMAEEQQIQDRVNATSPGTPVTMASDITKLYGLTRRTRTAAINAAILPKMMATANATESSVREAGVTVPLMIMRGDGGVMEIGEMRKRPILTALSGPAASVMGSLMYLRASNAIYFEVGGTTTNIGVIKNGRPGVDYANIGGHDTYINSLDVRILGCAGGSMVRISNQDVIDVGPRSAHIAGCEYACFTPEEEIVDPEIVMLSPKPGDPSDYVAIRLANGKLICFTNTDAANVLGLVDDQYFAHGNVASARKAMQPVADKLGITIEELATKILEKDYEKVKACIDALAEKYQLDAEAMRLVGCGGGAAALVPYCAEKMGIQYSIPENAEVISSIGVALAMVRDVVERVIPNPTQEDIRNLKKEAIDSAIDSGASPDTVEVHIEIDNQTGKVTAIATGSTEVKTTDLLKECSEDEALELATEDFGPRVSDVHLLQKTDHFFVYGGTMGDKTPVRVVDKKGFVRVQCSDASTFKCKVSEYQGVVGQLWEDLAVFKTDTVIRPDYFVCFGPRVTDYSAVDLEQIYLLMDLDLGDREPDEEIILVGAVNDVG